MASKKSDGGTGVIATATVYRDGALVRGKIPAPVVRELGATDGDVLVFERRPGGGVVLRKSTAAERKGRPPKPKAKSAAPGADVKVVVKPRRAAKKGGKR